jgi:Trypsin
MKSFKLILVLFSALTIFSTCTAENMGDNEETEVSSFILYGTPDTSQAHQAAVFVSRDEGGGYVGNCTGTLISNNVVLTAAHCVGTASEMTVYFGNSTNSFTDMRTASEVQIHPGYNPSSTNVSNDIALIRLSSNAPTSIVPIPPLPSSNGIVQSDMNTTPLQYVGFGQTETGSSGTKLTITRPAVAMCTTSTGCSFNLSGMGVNLPGGAFGIAMDSTNGGICSGDSGGPAFVIRGNTEYVAGVSSWVLKDQNDNCAYFGASTMVNYFETFIYDFLGTSAEICTNSVDDDDDGLIDCDDGDCSVHPDCLVHACDEPIDIFCGDTLSGSTSNADSFYNDYSSCSNGALENGAEVAFRINAPAGSEITATLTPSSTSSNLDLFVSKNGCTPENCIKSSIFPTGQIEQVFFTTDSNQHFLMVETYLSAGQFTLSLNCDNNSPMENCTNGTDDDDDGRVDCADSDCTYHTNCNSTNDENCTNGTDDDNDSLVDCDDADCANTSTCLYRVEDCTNYIDDDGDLAGDCADIDCASHPNCNITTENCSNGIDDDGNGKADCNDPVCSTSSNCKILMENCTNGVDDDGDSFIDCNDPDCHSFSSCPLPSGEICYNSYDDDGDGKGDCDDSDCNGYYLCTLVKRTTDTTSPDPDCGCRAAGSNSSTPPLFLLFFIFGFFYVNRKFSNSLTH